MIGRLGLSAWGLLFSAFVLPILTFWSGSSDLWASWSWFSGSDLSGRVSRVSALSGPSCRVVALWSRTSDLDFSIPTIWSGSSDLWLVSGLGSLRIGEVVSAK